MLRWGVSLLRTTIPYVHAWNRHLVDAPPRWQTTHASSRLTCCTRREHTPSCGATLVEFTVHTV